MSCWKVYSSVHFNLTNSLAARAELPTVIDLYDACKGAYFGAIRMVASRLCEITGQVYFPRNRCWKYIIGTL